MKNLQFYVLHFLFFFFFQNQGFLKGHTLIYFTHISSLISLVKPATSIAFFAKLEFNLAEGICVGKMVIMFKNLP